MKNITKNLFMLLSICLMTLYNCEDTSGSNDNDNDKSKLPMSAEEFDTLVRSRSGFLRQEEELLTPTVVQENAEPSRMRTVTESKEGGVMETRMYNCTVHKYKAAPGYNELFLLNPTSDFIYPGAVIDGASIEDGRYVPIIGKRKPLNISVSIIGVTNRASATVDNPSLSKVREAYQPLLSTENTDALIPAANSVFSVRELHHETQFSLALGVNIQAQVTPTFAANLGAEFGVEDTTEKQSYVARFAHRYFTIDIDLPANPSDLFEEFPTLTGDVSPVYISSVTYGRMVLFNLQSNRSSLEINAALTAGLSIQDRVDFSTSLSTKHRQALNETNINSTVIGGSGMVCGGVTSIEDLGACIHEGSLSYQSGVPIAYQLRFLKDNSVARVVLASEYNARQCDLTTVGTQSQRVFRLQEMRTSNDDVEAFSFGALELVGQILLRPTDEEPGDKGPCTEAEAGNDAYETIFNFGDPGLGVGGGWYNVENSNYRASVAFPGTNQNLSICTRLRDRDRLLDSYPNKRIDKRQVIDPRPLTSGGQPAGGQNGLRFRGVEHHWVDIKLQLQ